MRVSTTLIGLAVLAVLGSFPAFTTSVRALDDQDRAAPAGRSALDAAVAAARSALHRMQMHLLDDLAALEAFRPGYAFWRHIFTIPDGAIAFGSEVDGRLLAVFPARGDWTRAGDWKEKALAATVTGRQFASRLSDRRDQMAELLEADAGPVLHNFTRGDFLQPNTRRYGPFLDEWGTIYERFGVPAEIGLAQAAVESGLNGTVRSRATAIGFCQWLATNWRRLQRLAPHVIEGHNQTTQAPYCAAYLTVLATKYGTFIPALSEHHAGGTNVGRTVINGSRLGGENIREQYLLGAEFVRDLRQVSRREYRDIYGTYGPRSFRYAEMVFGNTLNIRHLRSTIPQEPIHAMRTTRAIGLSEITRRTRLSADEVRRFNPALNHQVPARATLYLPAYVADFGADVTFWHRAPDPGYADALRDFVAIEARFAEWDSPGLVTILRSFKERFRQTGSEEGAVMSTVLAFVIDDIETSGRRQILDDYRANPQMLRLFDRAAAEREAAREAHAEAR